MIYLISHITFSLFIAFLLGLWMGYLLFKKKEASSALEDVLPLEGNITVQEATDPNIENAPLAAEDYMSDVDLDGNDYAIETLEGIGPKTGSMFRDFGIATIGDYLRRLHEPGAREKASEELNILIKPLNNWASMADLLRVGGMNHQFAELAYATGVLTVGELASSNAASLAAKMERTNKAGRQNIAPEAPNADMVADWIERAKSLPPLVIVSA